MISTVYETFFYNFYTKYVIFSIFFANSRLHNPCVPVRIADVFSFKLHSAKVFEQAIGFYIPYDIYGEQCVIWENPRLRCFPSVILPFSVLCKYWLAADGHNSHALTQFSSWQSSPLNNSWAWALNGCSCFADTRFVTLEVQQSSHDRRL